MIRPIGNLKTRQTKHSEYAPKSVRPANQQRSPKAAEGEFPRSVRYASQQGRPSAENETPGVGLRPSSERDAKLWRKSLDPEIMHSSSSASSSFWNPWWPISIIIAAAVGTAIGVYIVDGATWRKAFGFGTNTIEATSRLNTPKSPTEVSSPAAPPPIASAAPQPANRAPPAGGLPVASQAHQPESAGLPITSAAPQPTNAAPAATSVPTVTAAPQPTGTAPARVATAEEPSAERAHHPRRD